MGYDALAEQLFGVDATRLSTVFLLVFARVAALAGLAPWLGWRGTAFVVRVTVAVALACAVTPLALDCAPALPVGWLPLVLLGLREVLVGALFAVAVSVPLYALGWTGQLIDRWRGSPVDSTIVGPGGGASPLGTLHLTAGIVLFVLLGGHRLALAAFADGLVSLPPGGGPAARGLASLAWGAARQLTVALELTVAFAVPAVVAFLLLEAALGLWSRVAPGIRLWMEGMPLRAALGVAVALLGLSALLPRLGVVFVRSIETAAELMRAVR